jgi:hypothetical protein
LRGPGDELLRAHGQLAVDAQGGKRRRFVYPVPVRNRVAAFVLRRVQQQLPELALEKSARTCVNRKLCHVGLKHYHHQQERD